MPLPLILGIGAAIAGGVGVGAGVKGAVDFKEANDTAKAAERRHQRNIDRLETTNKQTLECMDDLGKYELGILHSFEEFSNLFELIQNKPDFHEIIKSDAKLPEYDEVHLRDVAVGAGVLLGGMGGAALGTAGGFAAAGATTAAVMALGTASTGTAIASLSGAAAANATLAALGGGALAAGGGGIALGTAVLGGATLGVGLLIGGIIFSVTGSKISEQADQAWSQMRTAEIQIDKICAYLNELEQASRDYKNTLVDVNAVYKHHMEKLQYIVIDQGKWDWNYFTPLEKTITKNTVMLVGLLYEMCKVELVLKSGNDSDMKTVNHTVIDESTEKARTVLEKVA